MVQKDVEGRKRSFSWKRYAQYADKKTGTYGSFTLDGKTSG